MTQQGNIRNWVPGADSPSAEETTGIYGESAAPLGVMVPGPLEIPPAIREPSAGNQPRRKWPHYLVVGGLTLVLVGALGALKAAQIRTLIDFGKAAQKAGPPPEVVNSDVVVKQTWPAKLSAIATVTSTRGVMLSNDAPGVIASITFDSGDTVKAGQVLLQLDSSVERAELASLRARQKLARIAADRTSALVRSGALAPAELDSAESTLDSLNAEAQALGAQIARKQVRAPFTGKLGLRQVNLGQYLAPGTPIAVLESEKSSSLDFALPQQELANLTVGMPVRALEQVDGRLLADGNIVAIDPSVDAVTRTIKVRASLADDEGRLRPGMFVRAEVGLEESSSVVAVPATAIVRAPYGDSLFLVEPMKHPGGAPQLDTHGKPKTVARQQFVRLGPTLGDFVAVLHGIDPGQSVVTQGAFKLRNGVPIQVDNQVTIKPELAPNPTNS